MKITSITVKPLDSGFAVRVQEGAMTSEIHNHAFSDARQASDFVGAMLFGHEKGREIAAKSPKTKSS